MASKDNLDPFLGEWPLGAGDQRLRRPQVRRTGKAFLNLLHSRGCRPAMKKVLVLGVRAGM